MRMCWWALTLSLISGFEGLRQAAYLDPVGVPTVCFGHTQGVMLGDTKTLEACHQLPRWVYAKATKMTYVASGSAVVTQVAKGGLGIMTSVEWINNYSGFFLGGGIGVLTFATNFYFQRKRQKSK